jgi:hypothetical protein
MHSLRRILINMRVGEVVLVVVLMALVMSCIYLLARPDLVEPLLIPARRTRAQGAPTLGMNLSGIVKSSQTDRIGVHRAYA